MTPKIVQLSPKKLVGRKMTMSLSQNKTGELWKGFMPRRHLIPNTIGRDCYAVQIYDQAYFRQFNPNAEFEKWATIEVSDFADIPEDMFTLDMPGGMYAVFLHQGPASAGARTFQHIFGTWLPNSDFHLDHRPHFELLGEKYKNEDPGSEEEFWIPVVPKK